MWRAMFVSHMFLLDSDSSLQPLAPHFPLFRVQVAALLTLTTQWCETND